jgi:hypothetical protein
MKIIAYLMSAICLIAAIMYYALPGGSLPTFMPGYDAGSTHVHQMHSLAAVAGAIVFLLIGLSSRPRFELFTQHLERCRLRSESE